MLVLPLVRFVIWLWFSAVRYLLLGGFVCGVDLVLLCACGECLGFRCAG